MALNTLEFNCLTSLHFKGLNYIVKVGNRQMCCYTTGCLTASGVVCSRMMCIVSLFLHFQSCFSVNAGHL